jgi:hypothetical protein
VAADVAGLTRRVAELERCIDAFIQADGVFANFCRRIEALEQRPSLEYRDVWRSDTKYLPGHVVTFAGSMWCAKIQSTGVRPNNGEGAWRLCVKSGRDGKDAPQPKEVVVR